MRGFYWRWILGNGVAEALGLGGTLMLAGVAADALGPQTAAPTILVGAAVAILFGAFLEGTVIGFFQARVLRGALAGFPVGRWIGATTIGAGLAWTLGMVPSTVISLVTSGDAALSVQPSVEPPAALIWLLAAGLGLVLGPFLGWPQARVLRSRLAHPYRWIGANMAAWAVGMPLIFAAMGTLPPDPSAVRIAVTAVLGSLTAGLAVGAIHGVWLARALGRQEPPLAV
ncbi:MAG: hypothetical protein AB7L66_16840 [Gemmatimonadales bacterium]